MMASQHATLLDALVTDLTAAVTSEELPATFTPTRGYAPEYKIAELSTLRVSLVWAGTDTEDVSRVETNRAVSVNVWLQKHVGKPSDPGFDAAAVDDLAELAEAIQDHYRGAALASPDATCRKQTLADPPLWRHLVDWGVCSIRLELTWDVLTVNAD